MFSSTHFKEKIMNTKLNHLNKNESGITALETAIILIAFVVVAAIFAFTVLSTGTFLTEKSKEASYAGLQEVRGSLALRGSMVLQNTGGNIVFTLSPVAGGSAVDVSQISITYRDKATTYDVPFKTTLPTAGTPGFIVTNPAGVALPNNILDQGGLGMFNVQPGTALTTAYWTFDMEIKPPTGGVLLLERTTPAKIDVVTDLK